MFVVFCKGLKWFFGQGVGVFDLAGQKYPLGQRSPFCVNSESGVEFVVLPRQAYPSLQSSQVEFSPSEYSPAPQGTHN